jgi:WD40 repeat protein
MNIILNRYVTHFLMLLGLNILQTKNLYPMTPFIVENSGHEALLMKIIHNDPQPIKIIGLLQGHTKPVVAIDQYGEFEKDARRIVTGSQDNTIKIWDPETYQCVLTLTGHTNQIWFLKVMPSWFDSSFQGSVIVSNSTDGTFRIWWVFNDLLVRSVVIDAQVGCAAAIAPYILALGLSNGLIRIWDIRTGRVVQNLVLHTDLIQELITTPDLTRLISKSRDRLIYDWDLTTYQPLCGAIYPEEPTKTHIKIIDDNQYLLWSSQCWIINPKTCEWLRSFDPALDAVWNIQDFNQNQIICLSIDGTLLVYDYLIDQPLEKYVLTPNPGSTVQMTITNQKMFMCSLASNTVFITENPSIFIDLHEEDCVLDDCCVIL